MVFDKIQFLTLFFVKGPRKKYKKSQNIKEKKQSKNIYFSKV